MDLRTKLVFALVSVSLASMLALAFLIYGPASAVWRTSALQGLDALAESKQSEIENVVEAWRDRVRLIRSRTELRRITIAFNRTHSRAELDRATRILQDAEASVPGLGIREITVYDSHLHPLATSLRAGLDRVAELDPSEASTQADGIRFLGLTSRSTEDLQVRFSAPLLRDTVVVGTLVVTMGADEIIEVTEDYTGLGLTGETIIARLDGMGGVTFLNTPRTGLPPSSRRSLSDQRDPIVQALQGVESTFYRGTVDYRDEEVWAATRYLRELEIGLVVKFDRIEQEAPLRELRRTMTRLSLSLSGFAILAGILVGLRFAEPIHQLVKVAEKIERGNFHVRAPVRTEDEIGKLAQVFNQMTDRLLSSNRELRRQIDAHERGTPPPGAGGPEDPASGI